MSKPNSCTSDSEGFLHLVVEIHHSSLHDVNICIIVVVFCSLSGLAFLYTALTNLGINGLCRY